MPEIHEPFLERMAAGMFAEHHLAVREADGFGRHDFVSGAVCKDAVLVDARFMGERVFADDCLVRLAAHARSLGNLLGNLIELCRIHPGGHIIVFLAGKEVHDDLFEGCVSRALAEAVDRTFDLARAGKGGGKAVRDAEAEIVVAVDGEDGLVDVRNVCLDPADEGGEFFGYGIADRIGYVYCRGTGVDDAFDHAVHEDRIRPGGVLEGKLDVAAEVAGVFDHFYRLLVHLVGILFQLEFHVDGTCREESMDTGTFGFADGAPGRVDVLFEGAAE